MNHEDTLPRAKGSIIRMSQTPRDPSTNNFTTQRLLISYPEHGSQEHPSRCDTIFRGTCQENIVSSELVRLQ
jgi:hypothetical protein